jgi:hypothetical protein
MEIYLEESLPTAGENSELSGVGGVLNKCLYTRPCAEKEKESLAFPFSHLFSSFSRLNIDLFTTFSLLHPPSSPPPKALSVNSLYYCPHVQMEIIFLRDMSIN